MSRTATRTSYQPCCDRIIGTDAARAVDRFNPDGPAGYRARSGGPLRASRVDAVRDDHFALSPSCDVFGWVTQ